MYSKTTNRVYILPNQKKNAGENARIPFLIKKIYILNMFPGKFFIHFKVSELSCQQITKISVAYMFSPSLGDLLIGNEITPSKVYEAKRVK